MHGALLTTSVSFNVHHHKLTIYENYPFIIHNSQAIAHAQCTKYFLWILFYTCRFKRHQLNGTVSICC